MDFMWTGPRLPGSRSARAKILLVDRHTGQGHVAEVAVDLRPGTGRVEVTSAHGVGSSPAADLAIHCGLSDAKDRWNVRWGLHGASRPVTGDSLGLGLGVATWAALHGRSVPLDMAFTGRVATDGRIEPVEFLAEKLAAAAAARVKRVVIPACGDLPEAPPGITVLAVRELKDAIQLAVPPRRRLRPVALLLAPALALMGVTFGGDLRLLLAVHRLVERPGPDKVITLEMGVSEREAGDWRELINALPRLLDRETGAAVVVVDVHPTSALPEPDRRDLQRALDAADAAQPVLFVATLPEHCAEGPRPYSPDCVNPPQSLVLDPSRLGHPELEVVDDTWLQLRLALPNERNPLLWALSLKAAMAAQGRAAGSEQAYLADQDLPVQMGRLWLATTDLPPVYPLGDHTAWPDLKGKVALVGERYQQRDIRSFQGATVHGVDLHAAATQAILARRVFQRISAAPVALVSLLVGVAAALIAWGARARLEWLGLLALPAVLALLVALDRARLALAPIPVLLAVPVGVWVGLGWRR